MDQRLQPPPGHQDVPTRRPRPLQRVRNDLPLQHTTDIPRPLNTTRHRARPRRVATRTRSDAQRQRLSRQRPRRRGDDPLVETQTPTAHLAVEPDAAGLPRAGVDGDERSRRRVHEIHVREHREVAGGMQTGGLRRRGHDLGIGIPTSRVVVALLDARARRRRRCCGLVAFHLGLRRRVQLLNLLTDHLGVDRQRDAGLLVGDITPTLRLAVQPQPAGETPTGAESLERPRRRRPARRPPHHLINQHRIEHRALDRHEVQHPRCTLLNPPPEAVHVRLLAALVTELPRAQPARVHRVLAPTLRRPVGAQPARVTHPRINRDERARRRLRRLAVPILAPTLHRPVRAQPAHMPIPHTHRPEHPTGMLRRPRQKLLRQVKTEPTSGRTREVFRPPGPTRQPAAGTQTARPIAIPRTDRREHTPRHIRRPVPPTLDSAISPQTAPERQPPTDRHKRPLRQLTIARSLAIARPPRPPTRHRTIWTQPAPLQRTPRQQPRQPTGLRHRLGQPRQLDEHRHTIPRRRVHTRIASFRNHRGLNAIPTRTRRTISPIRDPRDLAGRRR